VVIDNESYVAERPYPVSFVRSELVR